MQTIRKHVRLRVFSLIVAAILVSVELFPYAPAVCTTEAYAGQESETGTPQASQTPQETGEPQGTESPQETLGPQGTESPQETGKPQETQNPQGTGEPQETENPQETDKPSLLKAVSGVKLARYSTGSVKVTWNKHKKAKYYRVYYYNKNKKAKLAGTTKSTQYIVKKLKNKTKYYFYVVASTSKKASSRKSYPSKKVSIKTRKYVHKTIFAGDSICQGIAYGQAFPQMHMEGKKKVIAYRGLNTVTFHTKRIFNGQTGLQKLLAEKPYRVYMMLGMNEVHYRKTGDMIAEYKGMIQQIKKISPDTDIVLCALSPVTRAERARLPGYWQISLFNKKLKNLAKQTGVHYFDYTGFLKDSSGYLKAEYAERDGYHWKSPAYSVFGKIINKYEKSLDK